MHLADDFIQGDLNTVYILSVCLFPGNRPMTLALCELQEFSTGAYMGFAIRKAAFFSITVIQTRESRTIFVSFNI